MPETVRGNPKPSIAGDTAAASHRKALLAALDVSVPPCEVPAGYGLAMGSLAVALVLIPFAYVALVAFLAWLLIWHVFQAIVSLQYGPYFIFHIPMALLGGLLLLFLIKPVFFRQRESQDGVLTLKPDDEPLLFAFVEKLCAATGSRPPALIEIDCEPNAGARLHRRGRTGAIGGALGGQLVLRIGLPLVAAMPVKLFAGVLAHEFGHFNQRSGMTGSYLIRRLVAFFAKIVFQRDRLDEKLARMRASRSHAGRFIFWAAAWVVEAARGVLWLMLIGGEMLTCGVLRRMEYDADRVEAHISGTREFVRTSKLILFLSIAARRARYDLADAWQQRRLADDLPRFIVAHARQLAEHREDILKLLDKEKTGWFDTHPCHTDRVRSVEATSAAGLVQCDIASKHLFTDFDALCRRATVTFYRTVVGESLDQGKLVPTSELVDQRIGERQSFDALRRFYRNGAAATRPLLPGAEAIHPAREGGVEKLIEQLSAVRQEMVHLAINASAAAEQFETSNTMVVISHAKLDLAGIFYSRGAKKLRSSAEKDLKQHGPLRLRSGGELRPFEDAARCRMTLALRLAQTPPWSGQPRDQQRARRLVEVCCALAPQLERIESLKQQALQLRVQYGAYNENQPYPILVKRILNLGAEMVDMLRYLRGYFESVPYPFSHAQHNASVAQTLITKLPNPKDPGEVHGAANALIDRFYDLVYRVLAELADRVERVERGIGLEPLPEPPPRPVKKDDTEEIAQSKRNTRKYWIGYGLRAAGGVAMLCMLVWLSVSPPALPSMGWRAGDGSNQSYAYRPAPFTMSTSTRQYTSDYRTYAPPPLPANTRPGNNQPNWPQQPQPGWPQQPSRQQGSGSPQSGYHPSGPPSYQPSGGDGSPGRR